MQDNANYSYISTVITPDSNTHYIKDAEARSAITSLETSKQDKIDSSHKLPASNVSGLATVATSGDYNDLENKPDIPEGVEVDTAMSSTSTNPVQNKVIYSELSSGDRFSLMRFKGSTNTKPGTYVSGTKGDLYVYTENNNPSAFVYFGAGVTPNGLEHIWYQLSPTVDAAMSDSSYNPVQNKIIKAYVDNKISGLGTVLNYKGTKSSYQQIIGITSAKAGDVWINTADNSEYVCKQDISTATAAAWEMLGPTIDLSGYALKSELGGFAYISNYTPQGTISINPYTPSATLTYSKAVTGQSTWSSVNQITAISSMTAASSSSSSLKVDITPAGSVTVNSYTPEGSISVGTGTNNYTPAGNISINSITPAGSISTGTGTANYTPAGSVTINNFTPSGSISTGTGAANYTPAGNITVNSYTPEGTVSAPDLTIEVNKVAVNSITAVGTLPTWSASVTNETLSFSFNQGTLPTKGSNTSVVTSIKSASASQPTFTGTAKAPTGSFSGTGVELKFAGTSVTPTGSFSGTGVELKFTGTAVTPTGSFSGTGTNLKFTGTAKAPTGSFSGTTKYLVPSSTDYKVNYTGTQATLTGSFTGTTTNILPPDEDEEDVPPLGGN